MIVLDASAAVRVLLGLPPTDRIRERLDEPGESLHAPHVFDLEVLNTLRRHLERASEERAGEAFEMLQELDISLYPHEPVRERIWALRANLTAYDAVYVALAETLAAPLVTTDSKLAKAPGVVAEVEVFA